MVSKSLGVNRLNLDSAALVSPNSTEGHAKQFDEAAKILSGVGGYSIIYMAHDMSLSELLAILIDCGGNNIYGTSDYSSRIPVQPAHIELYNVVSPNKLDGMVPYLYVVDIANQLYGNKLWWDCLSYKGGFVLDMQGQVLSAKQVLTSF